MARSSVEPSARGVDADVAGAGRPATGRSAAVGPSVAPRASSGAAPRRQCPAWQRTCATSSLDRGAGVQPSASASCSSRPRRSGTVAAFGPHVPAVAMHSSSRVQAVSALVSRSTTAQLPDAHVEKSVGSEGHSHAGHSMLRRSTAAGPLRASTCPRRGVPQHPQESSSVHTRRQSDTRVHARSLGGWGAATRVPAVPHAVAPPMDASTSSAATRRWGEGARMQSSTLIVGATWRRGIGGAAPDLKGRGSRRGRGRGRRGSPS